MHFAQIQRGVWRIVGGRDEGRIYCGWLALKSSCSQPPSPQYNHRHYRHRNRCISHIYRFDPRSAESGYVCCVCVHHGEAHYVAFIARGAQLVSDRSSIETHHIQYMCLR